MTASAARGIAFVPWDLASVISGPVVLLTYLKNMAFDSPVVENDWNFRVKLVVAELTTAPPSRLETPVTPRVVLAVTAAAARVPVKVGDAENTRLVLVVPVAPAAV